MKNRLIAMLLIVGGTLPCCNAPTRPRYDVDMAVLVDRTGGGLSNYPTAQELIGQLGLRENRWKGCRVTCGYIGDRDATPRTVIAIEKQAEWTGNAVARGAELKSFRQALGGWLDTVRRMDTCRHSIIYRNLAEACNTLAASRSEKRLVLVFSDLAENSTDLNLYSPEAARTLRANAGCLERRLLSAAPLANLSGIAVRLLYDPPTYEDNNRHRSVFLLFRRLLERRGATVRVDAKLQSP